MTWRIGWIEEVSNQAISAVTERLEQLGAARLEEFAERFPLAAAAWRLTVEAADQEIDLDLWVPLSFPWEAPRILLADTPAFPSIPHVEMDGRLCLLPTSAEWSTSDPVGLVEQLIVDAQALLSAGMLGRNREDFRTEALSYWEAQSGWTKVRSLLASEGPSRPISVWAGKTFTVVGDEANVVRDWVRHRFPALKSRPRLSKGLLCWLDRPPLPGDLPQTIEQLLDMLGRCGILDQLPAAIASAPDGVLIAIGFPAATGGSFLGVTIYPSRPGRQGQSPNRDWLAQGFRHREVPGQLVRHRFARVARLARRTVDRFDGDWVHGRDQNRDVQELRTATVAMVGCGSLGSSVARLLAQAGVGALTLIDPELLAAANTGRHLLGSASVGLSKAVEVGRRLSVDFPHLFSPRAVDKTWQKAVEAEPSLFDDIDIVVSTVGSWTTEGMLDAWLRQRGQPVVYGWVEPEALAGQSVFIDHREDKGCLACGMSHKGVPLLRVTNWPASMLVQEPACGAFFQPYGAVQLERGAVAVAELVLDALLGRATASTHRPWSGSQRALNSAGGTWSPEWIAATGDVQHQRELDLVWPHTQTCEVCGG